MPEMPPMMPPAPKPEKNPKEMSMKELEEKIDELTVDLDNAAKANQGSRELQTILAEIINDRAKYEMERQKRIQKS